LEREWANATVYPPPESIFRALNSVPLDQVCLRVSAFVCVCWFGLVCCHAISPVLSSCRHAKTTSSPAPSSKTKTPNVKVRVVVLGQDPYFNPGEAMGLSFSVPRGVRAPSSLRNIYKELGTDVGATPPRHGDLEKWCRQGVLLLNAALTVRAGAPNSHAKAGWHAFTTAAVAALARRRKGLVFLLWGRFAQDRAAAAAVDASRHHLLKSAHPLGLSASRGFFGCKHFSQANALLQAQGLPPIDWQIDE
jgi:uracil-DNA glycosylase